MNALCGIGKGYRQHARSRHVSLVKFMDHDAPIGSYERDMSAARMPSWDGLDRFIAKHSRWTCRMREVEVWSCAQTWLGSPWNFI